MMKLTRQIAVVLLGVLALAACGSEAGPFAEAGDITLRNTLEEGGGPETAYPALFGLADDAFDEFATYSDSASEFPTALAQPDTPFGPISGLYNFDFTEDRIEVTLVPTEDDPFWTNVFEVFPAGKIDRYYFTFADGHGVESFESSDDTVRLRIDSPTVLVVEMTEGYSMNPGTTFTIDVE